MTRLLVVASCIVAVSGACRDASRVPGTPTREAFRVVDSNARARIDSTLAGFVARGLVAGVSALVWEKDEEAYFGAFGMADGRAGIPMARNTIVQIYSMTKPLTGVTLMTLYDEGVFDLDDPVHVHAPEFTEQWVFAGVSAIGEPILEPAERPASIRDLTRHTSGLTSSPGSTVADEMLRRADPLNWNNSLVEVARRYSELPLWFQPGERWAYGPSVDIQAYLVECMTDRPFEQVLHERVLDRLGMGETRYLVPMADRNRMASLYRRQADGMLVQEQDSEAHAYNLSDWPLKAGGWGLTSTLDDYMRFTRMLLNEGELDGIRILQPETVQLMATNQLDEAIEERSWLPSKGQVGFGIDFAVRLRPPADPSEASGVVGEYFWDGAASTLFWVDPVNDLAAVFFVQLMPFDGLGLHKGFRDAVYGS